MRIFHLQDHGEKGATFLVLAESEEDAIEKYITDTDITEGWDEEARSTLEVKEFELPTEDDPVVSV